MTDVNEIARFGDGILGDDALPLDELLAPRRC